MWCTRATHSDACLRVFGKPVWRQGNGVFAQVSFLTNCLAVQLWKECKKLRNQLVELRGNIRVFARVRPLLPEEVAAAAASPVRLLNKDHVQLYSERTGNRFTYELDCVFDPFTASVCMGRPYDPLATTSCACVVDGYKVCIFAYGQTGSGKTHTMQGPKEDPGISTRALNHLFQLAAELASSQEVRIMASLLEVYNEQLRDLLRPESSAKLEVHENTEGFNVPGLTMAEVRSMSEVEKLLRFGAANRTVSSTRMNQHSSRSHQVLTVYLTSKDKRTGEVAHGKLHLIDLAGSERVSRTQVEGNQLKESQAINRSLLALGDVIQALQQKAAHIPYRNSKLTRLLEDSLGGQSKVLMVVACSPSLADVAETKCSLEFAQRVKQTELGQAQRQVVAATDKGAQRRPVPQQT
eukprot:jgi/Astpho2/8974/e_gw1.00133.97.1_t